MHASLVGIREAPRRLDDDVDAERLPGKLRRISDLEDLDLVAVHDDGVLGVLDRPRVCAVRGVVLEQEGVHRHVHDVVDGDDLDIGGALDERLEGLAADATEPVDAHAYGHVSNLRYAARWIG